MGSGGRPPALQSRKCGKLSDKILMQRPGPGAVEKFAPVARTDVVAGEMVVVSDTVQSNTGRPALTPKPYLQQILCNEG